MPKTRTIKQDAIRAHGQKEWSQPDPSYVMSGHRAFNDTGNLGGIYDIPAEVAPDADAPGDYTELQIVQNTNPANSDFIGHVSATYDGQTLVWGSANHDTDAAGANSLASAGAVWFAEKSGDTWGSAQKVVASDRAAGDLYGGVVEIAKTAGDVAIVGANLAGTGNGRAYILTKSGGTWSEAAILDAPLGQANAGSYGWEAGISDDGTVITVSEIKRDVDAVVNSGAVYVYDWDGATATLLATLTASDKRANDWLGHSIAISGDGNTISAGAVIAGTVPTYSGQVYIWTKDGTWADATEDQSFTLTSPVAADYFGNTGGSQSFISGRAIALSQDGSRLVTGAWGRDNVETNDGMVIGYQLSGGVYSQLFTILGESANVRFGQTFSMSADGNYFLAGEQGYDLPVENCGRVRLYYLGNTQVTGEAELLNTLQAATVGANEFYGFHSWIGTSHIAIVASDYNGAGTDLGAVYMNSYVRY